MVPFQPQPAWQYRQWDSEAPAKNRLLLRQGFAQRVARMFRQALLHLPEWGSQSQEIGRQFP
jgi:hypothetical protein